jgi:hypothetical protein
MELNLNAPKRWSRFNYRGRNGPKGTPDALERAKAAIGPFKSGHNPGTDTQFCSCENCMEKNINLVAAAFNTRKLILEGAPRKKAVVQNLARVREAARTLADLLIALDDYSRDDLLTPFQPHGHDDRETRLYKVAQITDLPTPETSDSTASDGAWVERLKALEQYVGLCLEAFISQHTEGSSVDQGGNTNPVRKRYGPPGRYLVAGCWRLFELCRPDEATATDGARFMQFVNGVYEYATGEIKENSSLHNCAKELAPQLRHYHGIRRKKACVEVELEGLKLAPHTPERDNRIAAAEAEVAALSTELFRARF